MMTLHLRCLYPILRCTTSGQMFVRDTAFETLEAVSRASGHGTNSEKDMFLSVKNLIPEILMAVDSHHMTSCILLMKVLMEFAKSVSKWFSSRETKVQSKASSDDHVESEETETPKSPLHIRMVVEILRRTKHIVSSPHLPLRLVTLDLIIACFNAVSGYDNDLLPMIHQNWPGVLSRFEDRERSVGCKAFEAILCMARLSGTFVYRRIIDELWPKLIGFLRSQAANSLRTGLIYQQTGVFRLQELIVSNLLLLCDSIAALEKDIVCAIELCELYLGELQPKKLQDAARSSIDTLRRLKFENNT